MYIIVKSFHCHYVPLFISLKCFSMEGTTCQKEKKINFSVRAGLDHWVNPFFSARCSQLLRLLYSVVRTLVHCCCKREIVLPYFCKPQLLTFQVFLAVPGRYNSNRCWVTMVGILGLSMILLQKLTSGLKKLCNDHWILLNTDKQSGKWQRE